MKKSRLKQFELDLYSETLDNGLLINVIPKPNVNNIYVTFSTKYGSIHDEFVPIDRKNFYKVPMGVAHFLEHKVFEQENGEDPFTRFSSNGADANANTSNFKTTYLFSGPSNLSDNLNFLLDFVQQPYFTDENVEKEKGIIAQELKMLHDKPYWRIYEQAVANSFVLHPIKYPVGGTLETIANITKEDLYTCYNTFYHPSNMFITVSGNVDPEEAINIIKKNQESKTFAPFKEIIIKNYDEPDNVACKYEELAFDVSLPKISHCYKINRQEYDINRLKLYLTVYFSLMLDSSSLLDEKLREKHLISNDIDYEIVNTDKHLLFIVGFESTNYHEVIDELTNTLGKYQITEEELNRKKKTLKSSFIYRSDNIFAINSKIDNNIIRYNEVILDDFSIIDTLNIAEMNDIIEHIDFNNVSTVVLKNN